MNRFTPNARRLGAGKSAVATRRTMRRVALALGVAIPGAAHAQYAADDTTLIRPALPEGFDRGRNVSVLEQPRPDYDPLGIIVSSFKVFPKVGVGVGATDNVFLSANKVSDGFAVVSPSITANSDWSRHQVRLRAATVLRRFFSNPGRNQTPYDLGALGALDISSGLRVTAEGQFARLYENPESGQVDPTLAVLSSFQRSFFSLRGEYSFGQAKTTLALDRSHFDFNDIRRGATVTGQTTRDRTLQRVTGQFEYAFTPSLSAYGRASFARTDYDVPIAVATPNLDSDALRLLGGFNFDLAGLMRGRLGVGYAQRDYDAPQFYRSTNGFSFDLQLEYFPSALTTFTLTGSRTLEDSNFGSNSPYFSTQVGLRVDHELLRNLLLNANARYSYDDYIVTAGPARTAEAYAFGGGARYLVSRYVSLEGNVGYSNRRGTQSSYDEVQGQLSLILTR